METADPLDETKTTTTTAVADDIVVGKEALMESNTDGKFRCKLCYRILSTKQRILTHLVTIHDQSKM